MEFGCGAKSQICFALVHVSVEMIMAIIDRVFLGAYFKSLWYHNAGKFEMQRDHAIIAATGVGAFIFVLLFVVIIWTSNYSLYFFNFDVFLEIGLKVGSSLRPYYAEFGAVEFTVVVTSLMFCFLWNRYIYNNRYSKLL